MVVLWPSGPVSVICSGAEGRVRVLDLGFRLLAGEAAEFHAADADAGQDPTVVLLAPCVQDAGADAEGEDKAEDERDAEAEGERPPAPRPCGGLPVGQTGASGWTGTAATVDSKVGDAEDAGGLRASRGRPARGRRRRVVSVPGRAPPARGRRAVSRRWAVDPSPGRSDRVVGLVRHHVLICGRPGFVPAAGGNIFSRTRNSVLTYEHAVLERGFDRGRFRREKASGSWMHGLSLVALHVESDAGETRRQLSRRLGALNRYETTWATQWGLHPVAVATCRFGAGAAGHVRGSLRPGSPSSSPRRLQRGAPPA